MRTTPNDRPSEPAQTPYAGPRTHPRGRPAVLRTAAVLLGVLLVASCSSSSKSTTPSASPSSSASATAPADVAAATAQVTANWEKFFNAATPIADRVALVENGDQLMPLLQGFAADPRVSQATAKVTKVDFTSATTANVTYDLSLQGQVVQPGATGTAVLENGTWKVSKKTLCGLVQLSGNTGLPGCS